MHDTRVAERHQTAESVIYSLPYAARVRRDYTSNLLSPLYYPKFNIQLRKMGWF